MPRPGESLLAGRATNPLTEDEVRRVTNVIIGLDEEVAFRHAPGEHTRCRIYREGNEELCEIVFGADIFPGPNVLDPNSSLSMRAAVAHELSHFHRWRDKTELMDEGLRHIDEALTSLDAVRRYGPKLYDHEKLQLVGDAMQRLSLYAQEQMHVAVADALVGDADQ